MKADHYALGCVVWVMVLVWGILGAVVIAALCGNEAAWFVVTRTLGTMAILGLPPFAIGYGIALWNRKKGSSK